MKRLVPVVIFCLILISSACNSSKQPVIKTGTKTPTVIIPTTTLEVNVVNNNAPTVKPPESTAIPQPTSSENKLYDPSIFIIEASGEWREELAEGYFADYEIEVYLHKIDPNDNRVVVGAYEGIFWMKTTLDTTEYVQNMLGSVPVEMTFDAGGEAISENLGMMLNTSVDKAWVDYAILDDNGQPLPLTRDTPVDKGSFVVVAKSVYLETHAAGIQGERVDYSTTEGTGDQIMVNYVIHVQPDELESNGQRKVTILFSGQGFKDQLVEGVMRRIPGYREDVADYYESSDYQNSTWRKIRE